MSDRRPRPNKKLNSNDRKAMVTIMSVLLRNCMAIPLSLELQYFGREQEEGHIGKGCKSLIL